MKSLLSVSLGMLGSASLAPAAIVIVNPSFESSDIANGTFLANGATDWSHGTTYLVDNNTTQNAYFDEAVPDGQQANSLAGSFMSQQLNDDVNGAVLTTTVPLQFEISFFAGSRNGSDVALTGSFTVLLQSFTGATWNGVDLAQQTYFLGVNDGNAATIDLGLSEGSWSDEISLNLTVAANPAGGNGKNIRVAFTGSGTGSNETAIDNVSVALIPEPSAALLGGLGLLALLRRRR